MFLFVDIMEISYCGVGPSMFVDIMELLYGRYYVTVIWLLYMC